MPIGSAHLVIVEMHRKYVAKTGVVSRLRNGARLCRHGDQLEDEDGYEKVTAMAHAAFAP